MCGIIAAFNQKKGESVNEDVINIFEDQHPRGTEGFGVIGIDGKGKPSVMRSTEGCKFMFDLHKKKWNMMVVHHRTPTSTKNKIKQTHPLVVSHEELPSDFLVIHNGVINNAKDLWKTHTANGYVYTTEEEASKGFVKWNDSEGLAIEAARFISKLSDRIEAIGSTAFIALELDKKTSVVKRVHFGRNTNPLNLAATRGQIVLSSEGKGGEIKAMTLYTFDPFGDMNLKKRTMPFAEEVYPVLTTEKSAWPKKTKENDKWGDYRTWEDREERKWQENRGGTIEEDRPVVGFHAGEDADLPPNQEDSALYETMADNVMAELDQFMAELSDPDTANFADVNFYVKNIASILKTVKSEAILTYDQRQATLSLDEGNTTRAIAGVQS